VKPQEQFSGNLTRTPHNYGEHASLSVDSTQQSVAVNTLKKQKNPPLVQADENPIRQGQ
jgi:hypothetical protein